MSNSKISGPFFYSGPLVNAGFLRHFRFLLSKRGMRSRVVGAMFVIPVSNGGINTLTLSVKSQYCEIFSRVHLIPL